MTNPWTLLKHQKPASGETVEATDGIIKVQVTFDAACTVYPWSDGEDRYPMDAFREWREIG